MRAKALPIPGTLGVDHGASFQGESATRDAFRAFPGAQPATLVNGRQQRIQYDSVYIARYHWW